MVLRGSDRTGGWIAAAAGLLLVAAACGYTPPPGPPRPTPTPVPLTAPELIEVRAGPGDGEPAAPQGWDKEYTILPQAAVKIVIQQPPLTVGRLVSIDGVEIPQVASDAMHGDDAQFTFTPLWRRGDATGSGDQEMIIVQPKAADRKGAGFTIRVSLGDAARHGPPLRIMVGSEVRMPAWQDAFDNHVVTGGYDDNLPPPQVLSSNDIAQTIANDKFNDPARTTYRIAIEIDDHSSLELEVQESPGLPADQARVHLENLGGRDKALWAINTNTGTQKGSLTAKAGQGAQDELVITPSDTTTLLLSRDVCTDAFCFNHRWEHVRIWSEPAFWKLVGGRWIAFTWHDR
jgi:hypothetical protein